MAESNPNSSFATSVPSIVPDPHTIEPVPTVWELVSSMNYFSIEIKMILSATIIIYLGAHASLRRPPSAAPPKKLKRKGGKLVVDDQKEHFAQGLEANDAFMFPLLAGTVLIGLYYLMKWLQNPTIINKILRAYLGSSALVGMGIFFSDGLEFLTSLVFPDYWVDRSGRIFEIDPVSRTQKVLKSPQGGDSGKEVDPRKGLPLPGFASELSVSAGRRKTIWMARHLLKEHCVVKLVVLSRRLVAELTVTSVLGFLTGCTVLGLYFYTNSTVLSNLLGLAVCYTSFIWMSVTSFTIGSMVLIGLFFYDILMVFYTPFMVAVATQVDAPIKLIYGVSGGRSSLLGLGDIVIPGIFVCLALRFDLWRHYQRKVTRVEENLETVSRVDSDNQNGNATETAGNQVTTVRKASRTVKAPFVDPRGQWGNYIWATSLWGLVSGQPTLRAVSDASFSKVYFFATMFGYLVGMLVTLVVVMVFKKGQPALLYLVPGVCGSAWLTGLLRGELKDMWDYTEDGSLDVEDVVTEVDGNGKIIEKPEKNSGEKKSEEEKDVKETEDVKEKEGGLGENEDGYELLKFSITLPKEDSLKED